MLKHFDIMNTILVHMLLEYNMPKRVRDPLRLRFGLYRSCRSGYIKQCMYGRLARHGTIVIVFIVIICQYLLTVQLVNAAYTTSMCASQRETLWA